MSGRYYYNKKTTTANQRKKHYIQMTDEEIDYLEDVLDEIETVALSPHIKDNIDVSRLNPEDFLEILKDPDRREIAEYSETPRPHGGIARRVLLKDTFPEKRGFHPFHGPIDYADTVLTFVIDIDTGVIVTAFYDYAAKIYGFSDDYDESVMILKKDFGNTNDKNRGNR